MLCLPSRRKRGREKEYKHLVGSWNWLGWSIYEHCDHLLRFSSDPCVRKYIVPGGAQILCRWLNCIERVLALSWFLELVRVINSQTLWSSVKVLSGDPCVRNYMVPGGAQILCGWLNCIAVHFLACWQISVYLCCSTFNEIFLAKFLPQISMIWCIRLLVFWQLNKFLFASTGHNFHHTSDTCFLSIIIWRVSSLLEKSCESIKGTCLQFFLV